MSRLLTICIPTYNRAAFLAEAIESFLADGVAKEGVNFVICDNASPDNTKATVEGFQSRGVDITYFRHPTNVGFSLNVIEAAKRAGSEYIWYFGDDDLIAPGTLRKVLNALESSSPQIAYLNHQGFSVLNPHWGNKPAHPEVDQIFDDGTRFFAAAGLGFLSALVVRRKDILDQSEKVVPSRNSAQIETAARIALSGKGPFLLLGTVTVLARIDANAGGNILTDGFVHPCEIYCDFVSEGILSEEFVKKWKRANLLQEILRRSVFMLCKGQEKKFYAAYDGLKSNFGDDPYFPWTVGLLPKIPIFLLKPPFLVLHLLITRLRLPLFQLLKAVSPKART